MFGIVVDALGNAIDGAFYLNILKHIPTNSLLLKINY
jgi:hypothetical protein